MMVARWTNLSTAAAVMAASGKTEFQAENVVGGDSDAVSFVSMRDEFEQDAGLGLILTNIRDVVEHDEIVFVELLEGADQGEVATRDLQPLDHVDGLSEQDP